MNANTIIVEELYQAPLEKVWNALTDKDQMKQWYFDIPDFRLEEGAVFNFYEPGGNNLFIINAPSKKLILLRNLYIPGRIPKKAKDQQSLPGCFFPRVIQHS